MAVLENGTIPEMAFVAFQCMFAVITPALITGAFAERMKFHAFVVFILLWAIFIYNPMAHWVWGGGFLAKLGALDFAGGPGHPHPLRCFGPDPLRPPGQTLWLWENPHGSA
jgi:Amt family ammonium transporter